MNSQLPQEDSGNDDVDQIWDHESQISHLLIPHAAITDNIRPKLIARRSGNMDDGYINHGQELERMQGSRHVAHEDDENRGNQFGDGKEDLVIPF